MDPTIWGKHMWSSIHFIALGFPETPSEKQKSDYKQFFENLYKVLPCNTCSEHLEKTLKNDLPLYANNLVNNSELFKWTVKLHNIVNKRLKKKEMSFKDTENMYYKRNLFQEAMCPSDDLNFEQVFDTKMCVSLLLICIISILINIYYIVFRKR